jgi:uncharacterized protein
MPTLPPTLSPGVYLQEVDAGTRPIEGVGTAVAAFVGLAAKGPANEATLVSNWTKFTETFGGFLTGSYLAHSVYGYFLNGGGNCFVVRIGADQSHGSANGSSKAVGPPPQAALGGYRVQAIGRQASTRRCRTPAGTHLRRTSSPWW